MPPLPSDQLADYDNSLSESQNAKAEQAQSLKLLLDSGNGSDLTITCDEHTFHVHSPIMCSRSDYFAIHRDASTRFPASDPHHVRLPDEDASLIEKMIGFVYTSEYSVSADGTTGASEAEPLALSVHASMYGLGEFYGIRSLEWVAAGQFKELVALWHKPYGAFQSSRLLDFVQAIKVVYARTPHDDRVLRDPIIRHIPENLHAMFGLEEFRALVNEVPEFMDEAFGEGVLGEVARSRTKGSVRRIREMCRLARRGTWPYLDD